MELTTDVYFSIGSNIGDRLGFLRSAVEELSKHVGSVIAVSPIYESDPVGFESKDKFLNACVRLETVLSPHETLAAINRIEREFGRQRTNVPGYSDRTLDIDIILYGQKVFNDNYLTIPHPHFRDRLFVLLPLRDIDEHTIDPVSGVAISRLLKSCKDTSGIYCTDLRLFI